MNIEDEKCDFESMLPGARSLHTHTHPAGGGADRYRSLLKDGI